jgi:hypothetical protein
MPVRRSQDGLGALDGYQIGAEYTEGGDDDGNTEVGNVLR